MATLIRSFIGTEADTDAARVRKRERQGAGLITVPTKPLNYLYGPAMFES